MTQAPVQIDVRMAEALAQVAYLPAAVQGSMKTALYDVVKHHRSSVIKGAKKWPGGRRAQAMVASRLHRYAKENENDAGVSGQSFGAAESGVKFGGEQLVREESGEAVNSREFMAVPVGVGREMVMSGIAGRRQQFRDLIASRELRIIKSKSGALFLVRALQAGRSKGEKVGIREQIIAMLTRKRVEPGRLGFYAAWDKVQSQDVHKLEDVIDLAATEAGRVKLAERSARSAAGRAAYTSAWREYLEANPRKFAQARAVANAAARAARGIIPGAEGRA